MTTSLVKTIHLALHWIRLPKGLENETGAEVVLEYKDVDTGDIVKVYGQKSSANKRQWIPEEQENYPDDSQSLLLMSSSVIDTWATTSIKYVKETML